ncbi:MAG: TraB/VirB10 family protein [Thermodesulfobacteriota bacterium]
MNESNTPDTIGEPEKPHTLKSRFSALAPETKRRLVTIGLIISLLGLFVIGYYARGNKTADKKKDDPIAEVRMDQNVLEKSLYAKTEELLIAQKKETDELKKAFKALQANLEKSPVREKAVPLAPPKPPAKETVEIPLPQKPDFAIPPPPPMDKTDKSDRIPKSLFNTAPPPQKAQAPQFIGGIEMVQAPLVEETKVPEGDGKKKRIYLPPSFMEATLLSGVAAPTTNAAKGNPLPLLFRVKDLAVLPNKVKANLKGCFVIGSGIGNLADERVHIRLNTLSCVARNGAAVIDQSIKGFIVDGDGKVGLKGRVVAKMGVHIARTALAGFIGGMGEALSDSTKTSTFSALGQPQSQLKNTDAGTIAKAGLGEGISSATRELQKFYLQLAEQTLPVIEIGSTKEVTIVISEGAGLDIMEKG